LARLVEERQRFSVKLGGNPSHPALLDWLASEFVRREFSMKQMHRLM